MAPEDAKRVNGAFTDVIRKQQQQAELIQALQSTITTQQMELQQLKQQLCSLITRG